MKLLFFILNILLCQTITAQFTNTEVIAKIKTEPLDDVISMIGTATNTTEIYKSLTYKMSVFRTDVNNNVSTTNQEGRFTLETNETKELSTTTINTNEQYKIVILLLIYEDEKIVGKDRVSFNEKIIEKQKTKAVEEDADDGIELKGIVIEETKTKPGKDFYDFFYNSYTLNQINGNKIVAVYEKLSFGRSTIIQVKIEDNLIHEFLGKPDLEYLEQMSKIAIRKVYKYFKDQKKQKKDIFQY
ncbi:CsgE family curli-type amyloid fiber assembly protein [Aquimarina algicola]|uniref:Curli production assembly/transport component CsgE n=1 Tax=Aquimarina algicola TaxID=2589995 RepID=A0A504JD85_9FLAO|nr:CsgE family curli-type amyloid fiber assembly protein [Aquimarina algicola]TPN84540.1 hypothetical protein FHK87_16545 [Aquimarina algicola]